MHFPPKMIEKVKFKSLDFGEKVTFTDKSDQMDVESSNSKQANASYLTPEGPSAILASSHVHDPFLLTKANNAVFFGPAQTLAAPSTSFPLFMSMISAKPRAANANANAANGSNATGGAASNKSLKTEESEDIGPVTEESLMAKFLVSS